MKKLLFTTLCLGTLMGIGNQSLALANPIENESIELPNVIDNQEIYTRSANFTVDITVGAYGQYISKTFDVNKLIGTNHNAIYVKFSPTKMSGKYTLRVFKNGSIIKTQTITGGSAPVSFTVENCTNASDKYYVTVNNETSQTLTGSLYVNTRIN